MFQPLFTDGEFIYAFGLELGITIGLAVAGIVSGIASSVSTYKSQKSANKTNKEIADENINIQKQQLAYQKYLNNNQIQIQSADAQKAGINPIAMQGGSLSSGSYSNVNAEQQGVDYGSGISDSLLSLAGNIASNKTSRANTADTNETSLSIAKSQQESNERIEETKAQAQVQSAMIMANAQNYNADMRSADTQAWITYRQKNDKVVNELQSKLNDSQIALNKAMEQKNLNDADYTILMNTLKQNEYALDKMLKTDLNDRQKQYLELAKTQLEYAIKDRKWKIANMLMTRINDFMRTGVMAVGAFNGLNLSSPSSVFGSDTSWYQGN